MATSGAAAAVMAAMTTLAKDHGGVHLPSTCKPHHSIVETSLSLFLCMGLIVSYLPQIIRIIIKRSSIGFSPWFLFLGATSSASSFLNVVSVQWAVVSCCRWLNAGACAESLLGIVQVGLQWFLFMNVFLLFLVYYPRELRYERAIVLEGEDQFGEVAGDEEEDVSSQGDLDSLDSHIVNNYGERGGVANGSGVAEATAAASGLTTITDESGGESALASRLDVNEDDDRSSSAFSRLVPTFWPVWKAPPRRHGLSPLSKVAATEPVALAAPKLADEAPSSSGEPSATQTPRSEEAIDENEENAVNRSVPGGNAAHVRISAPSILRKPRHRKFKPRSSEWGLALSLAWLVAFHFIFILLVTLLLVSSLPSTSFPPPPPQPDHVVIEGPSSRLLVDRWAAFLGWSAMILAALQYLPQIVHTARIKLVGSLSIPMMCLQVPGSVMFVYSLALRPGVNVTSLAAYICTGVLQAVLLGLCIAWRIRQRRLGIDDFGRPVPLTAD